MNNVQTTGAIALNSTLDPSPVSLSSLSHKGSPPRIQLTVVLIHDIMEQSGIFEDYDSITLDHFLDKLFFLGWAEVKTLREALIVLRESDDEPPKLRLYATALLGAMGDLRPDEIVLMNSLEWCPEWHPTAERELDELVQPVDEQ